MSVSALVGEDLRASYADAVTFPHPWLDHLQAVPWPLIRRLGTLLTTPEFYNVAPGIDAPEVLAPLYSQPAMELFLRIPLDVHFQDGRERGLARQAFAQDVPAEIIRRSWKDRAPGIVDRLVSCRQRQRSEDHQDLSLAGADRGGISSGWSAADVRRCVGTQ